MDNKKFSYVYSAPTEDERREIVSIRKQYTDNNVEESKYERLKRLDEKVKSGPTIISLVLGVVGILVFGLGLSMILEWSILIWGVCVCVVGAILCALAYPTYRRYFKINKAKYGEEILKLSEELLNQDKED